MSSTPKALWKINRRQTRVKTLSLAKAMAKVILSNNFLYKGFTERLLRNTRMLQGILPEIARYTGKIEYSQSELNEIFYKTFWRVTKFEEENNFRPQIISTHIKSKLYCITMPVQIEGDIYFKIESPLNNMYVCEKRIMPAEYALHAEPCAVISIKLKEEIHACNFLQILLRDAAFQNIAVWHSCAIDGELHFVIHKNNVKPLFEFITNYQINKRF